MKTKFLFILLLISPFLFTGCDEEDAKESCEDLGCQWYRPLDEDEFICSC